MGDKELIIALGINYEEAMNRFAQQEELYMKFLKKFCSDTGFTKLHEAITSQNREAVEASAHMLKGTSANLGLNELSFACNDMVCDVRENQDWNVLEQDFKVIENLHTEIVSLLKKESREG